MLGVTIGIVGICSTHHGYRIDPDEFRAWRASGCPGLPRNEAGAV